VTRFVVAMLMFSSIQAQAGLLCHEVDAEAECITDAQFRQHLDTFNQDNPHASMGGDDFTAIIQEARERGGTDTLLVDADGRFQAARLGRVLGEGRFEFEKLGIIAPPLPIMLPVILPPVNFSTLKALSRPTTFMRSSTSLDIHEDGGVNTDGQILYGPPGSAAAWGCTGRESIDSCKNCCMATRMSLLPGIGAFAVKCHTAANVNPWWHAACAVTEAVMLAGLWYSADKCNDNCECDYHNDRSIDWNTVQHSLLRQGLSTGEYDICEGWLGYLEWGGLDWLTLSSDYWDREGTYQCLMLLTGENDTTEELYWGAMNRNVRVVGEWKWDMRPIEYRIVDVDVLRSGRQIPYVGVTGVDDDGVYIELLRTGEKLYLDHYNDAIFESLKVWVYGERKGNRLSVQQWNVLWWSLLEGVL